MVSGDVYKVGKDTKCVKNVNCGYEYVHTYSCKELINQMLRALREPCILCMTRSGVIISTGR